MKRPASQKPIQTSLVLVGGGHTHVQVMTAFAMRPEPGVQLTLVTDRLTTPYSGMLPGHLAGIYSRDAMHIDLARLARATGTRLIFAGATGLDRAARRVLFANRPPLDYDFLSLNIGIMPDLSSVEGAETHAIAVKPIATFLERFQALLNAAQQPNGPRRLVVVGGGPAGVELAFALRTRLNTDAPGWGVARQAFSVSVVSSGALVPSLNDRARRMVAARLAAHKIAVATDFRVSKIDTQHVSAADGRKVQADACLFATTARAPSWLAQTDLPLDADGSVLTRTTLQVLDDDRIFAVGDCARIKSDPHEKAGVFAVRQGPVLSDNLRARTRGEAPDVYKAQRAFLTLLLTGDNHAIAARGRFLAAEGPAIWHWKDRIDRRFMAMFSDFGAEDARPPTEAELLSGSAMRCGGCAAKVGPAPLAQALHRLPPAPAPKDSIRVGLEAPDDGAVIEVAPGVMQVETIDQISAFIDDPYEFGAIAALHALNDVIAMGGTPTRALAVATLPHASPAIVERDLFQLLAGARAVLDAHHVALIGGHSAEGAQLALGFSVTGSISANAILRKTGAQSGDKLILTKPIGTGLIMAADMRGAAQAEASAAALASMRQSNALAGEILRERAHAGTDVTGFGLGGHLFEMLRGTQLSAKLDLACVPLIAGALELADKGFRSTLTAQNAVLEAALHGERALTGPEVALLFDPQTSGGLMMAVPRDGAEVLLQRLRLAGYAQAAIIGEMVPSESEEPRIFWRGSLT